AVLHRTARSEASDLLWSPRLDSVIARESEVTTRGWTLLRLPRNEMSMKIEARGLPTLVRVGSRLAFVDQGERANDLWDPADGSVIHIGGTIASPDARTLLRHADGETATLVDRRTHAEHVIQGSTTSSRARFSQTGRFLLNEENMDSGASLIDAASGKALGTISRSGRGLTRIYFGGHDAVVASLERDSGRGAPCGQDCLVLRMFDTSSSREMPSLVTSHD